MNQLSRLKMTQKVPISALPVSPSTHLLTRNLTPDSETPSVQAFREVLQTKPSIQRRSRIISSESHFSHVSPFPTPFPYDIRPAEDEVVDDKMAFVEKWLSERESREERPSVPSPVPGKLKKYYPSAGKRDQHLELIGLAETGLRDCVPNLDVGDALSRLGTPTLAHSFEDEEISATSEKDQAVRQELVEILSGHAMLMSAEDDQDTEFAPWSLRYSGHQFGVWAGQLGDGRAVSILSTPHPTDPELQYELQLKGSGRTPFSRQADGLAVLRSSIREYLCSEAMYALGIPTTRSLALVSLPALPVAREREETACVLTRLAPSFLRIGNFEAFNPPQNMFFLGGGQQERNLEGLRNLGEWVSKRVLRLGLGEEEKWGRALVLEVARRNARMVAGWQAYGFMHGVINTDNVSVLGLTIDYGPYAFMDVFNSWHICNHTDEEGRYAYKYQPTMIIYAARALLTALSPLIGAEEEFGKAVKAGWADDAQDGKIKEWSEKGKELVEEEMVGVIERACSEEYGRFMHKRLALRRYDSNDEADIVRPLLNIMEEHKLDFHSTFRKLCYFRPSWLQSSESMNSAAAPDKDSQSSLEKFLSTLMSQSPETDRMDKGKAKQDLVGWLQRYARRIESERGEWGKNVDEERESAAKAANPRFVLRQWVLEEVIRKVEQEVDSGKRVLAKVLTMACDPYLSWGAEDEENRPDENLDAETKEERRYCGIGENKMIGFQCSCSS